MKATRIIRYCILNGILTAAIVLFALWLDAH